MIDTNKVIEAYIDAALWSSSIEADGLRALREAGIDVAQDATDDQSLERMGFTIGDLDSSARANANATVESFLRTAPKAALAYWADHYGEEAIGHDLWLTQNRHGAGFWDREVGEPGATYGRQLTDEAHPYGEVYLYVGDRGRIFTS